jgi:hypothetical protein
VSTSSEKTNTLAIVSLVVALFVPLVGAILGHVAMGQIKKTGEQGRGIALAGVIIGWAFTALVIVSAVFAFVVWSQPF